MKKVILMILGIIIFSNSYVFAREKYNPSLSGTTLRAWANDKKFREEHTIKSEYDISLLEKDDIVVNGVFDSTVRDKDYLGVFIRNGEYHGRCRGGKQVTPCCLLTKVNKVDIVGNETYFDFECVLWDTNLINYYFTREECLKYEIERKEYKDGSVVYFNKCVKWKYFTTDIRVITNFNIRDGGEIFLDD